LDNEDNYVKHLMITT